MRLFPGMVLLNKSFVGHSRERTSKIAAYMMNLGGNPWGTYDQEEPCTSCGAALEAPRRRSIAQKICSAIAHRINQAQRLVIPAAPIWIHVVLGQPE